MIATERDYASARRGGDIPPKLAKYVYCTYHPLAGLVRYLREDGYLGWRKNKRRDVRLSGIITDVDN